MRALTFSDHVFLLLDQKKQPMHIAGVCVFEYPKNAPDDFLRRLVDDMRIDKIPPSFPFDQKLRGNLFWKTDDAFCARRHFRHVVLPPCANLDALFEYVSLQHSRPLDRRYPMWEFHLIEGLPPKTPCAPKRFALYLKIHHALADGVAAIRLLQSRLSTSPNDKLRAPLWSFIDAQTPKKTNRSAKNAVFFPKTFPKIYQAIRQRFADRNLARFTSVFDAPTCVLNQRIDATRKVSARSFAKARFVSIAAHFGVSTNDAILAVCSGALRRYLLAQNALPKKPLIAFAPICLRQDNSAFGNRLSFLLVNLGTHKADCRDRLRAVAASAKDSKDRFAALNQSEAIGYSALIYGLFGVNLATRLYPKKQGFNLIVSNVPSGEDALYFGGAKLDAVYPASVLFDGQALNITFTNRQNRIDFGITACDSVLPCTEKLLDYIKEEIHDLHAHLA